MNVALKTSSKYCFGDITEENIWGIFAQRMAAAIKFLFSSFFKTGPDCSTPNFKFMGPAVHVFCKYLQKISTYLLKKYLNNNLGSFASFKKGFNDF